MGDIQNKLREDAEKIYTGAIRACLPDAAVREALSSFSLPKGRLIISAIGKAAWRMARRAVDVIENEKQGMVDCGVVITKYGHSEGDINGLEIYEAAHPIPDPAGITATERMLKVTENLTDEDTVLFLVSGGGSALFESPYCSLEELSRLTEQLLASGADINEINAVRKHLSKVKGGRFAEHIYPAKVFSVLLSDVIGNRIDTIASGPCTPDLSTTEEVRVILEKYGIEVSEAVREVLMRETPKEITNAINLVGGSVSELCRAAEREALALGYKTKILRDNEQGIAREVGASLARLAVENSDTDTPLAFILGGETVVKVKGSGLGGRNQEIALAAAPIIAGYNNIAIFSVGSDGTDGPTDAAGGFACSESYGDMIKSGVEPLSSLDNNDSYNALASVGGLIKTGPTGTNVNDVSVVLIDTAGGVDINRRFANLERVLNRGIKND